MENRLRALGLDWILEEEGLLEKFVLRLVNEGTPIAGYSNNICVSTDIGKAQLFAYLDIDEGEQRLNIKDFDFHLMGPCVWRNRYMDVHFMERNSPNMSRLAMLNNEETGSFIVVNLLRTDVLPSFLENDEIEMQVVAFPEMIHYYKNEGDFADSVEECHDMKIEELNGTKLLPAMGTVFPNGFLIGHSIDDKMEPDNRRDELVLITGKVKKAYLKPIIIRDEEVSKVISVIVDTQYGELEIVHSFEMITEDEARIIEEGTIVQAVAALQGDVAIYKYENGLVKDFDTNLAALRYVLMKGNAERLNRILSDDAVYYSSASEKTFEGKEAIIDRLNEVHRDPKTNYLSLFAELDYNDEHCIILSEDEYENYVSIVRISVNEEGLITRIDITDDESLSFKIMN